MVNVCLNLILFFAVAIFRVPSHVKLCPVLKFLIPSRIEKNSFTREFQPGVKQRIFGFISPQGENIFEKICGISYKNF